MSTRERQVVRKEIPDDFSEHTKSTIDRIDRHGHVLGLLYLRDDYLEMYTIPENMVHLLSKRLPPLNRDMRDAVTEITSSINKINPVVDRIMDDESVEGVIMTNKEGAPVLTNISVTGASIYGPKLQQLGSITQMYMKEMDPIDEVLIVHLHTKKLEIVFAPNSEFNIVVLQHARHKTKTRLEKKKNNAM